GGRDLITEIPGDRWDCENFYGDPKKEENKTNSKWGGFLNNVAGFDAEFFGISPKEAEVMDPQQRLFLQLVWSAIEDAGYCISNMSGKKVGLFVGVSTSDYQDILRENEVSIEAYSALGITHSVLANRISYLFNWHGESQPIDTACSSSLVAIHRAVSNLQNGECEMVVAGGINCILSPSIFISFGKAGMLSPDGKCKTFDKSANGYVRGEGGGVVLLKPLKKAIQDRDHIYGVIRGSAVNHGGKTNSITSPNPNAQAEVIYEAVKKAGVDIESIGYVEAHGTGTSLGDPIEISGLKKAFSMAAQGRPIPEASCGLGAVKTNVGHLESAAGMAGVLKILLAMKNKMLPASINFNELNPYIDLKGSPFYIVDHTRDWKAKLDSQGKEMPRRAGVSSFGFSGVNSHILIEEYCPEIPQSQVMDIAQTNIFILSARKEERLKAYVKSMYEFIRKNNNAINLRDLTYTLQTGREEFDERISVIAGSVDDLLGKLEGYLAGKQTPEVFHGRVIKDDNIIGDLFSEDAGENYLINLISQKKYNKLAKLWVRGVQLNWNNLYTGQKPYRISLPTYPFELRKYWVKKNTRKINMAVKEEGVFDGPAIFAEEDRQIFKKTLLGKDWIVNEHQVSSLKILPAVMYLEMAHQAVKSAYPSSDYCVGEVVWLSPVVVLKDPKPIELHLLSIKGELNFEVVSYEAKGKIVHCKGKYKKAARQNQSTMGRVEVEEIEKRCISELPGVEHYSLTKAIGIEFGARFQTINKIRFNSNESLVYFKKSVQTGGGKYCLPFLNIDGAFQGISVFKPSKQNIKPLLPFYLDYIETGNTLTEASFAYIEKIKEDKYNISILDQYGNIIIKLSNVVVSEAKTAANTNITYTTKWEKEDLPEAESLGENVLVIANEASFELTEALRSKYGSLKASVAGTPDECGYDMLDSVERIYFLSGIQSTQGSPEDESYLRKAEEEGIMALFRLLKKLGRIGRMERPLKLTVVSNNVYDITKNQMIQPVGGSLYGFFNSAVKEYPNLEGNYLDVDFNELKTSVGVLSEMIIKEKYCKELKEIGLRQGQRYVRRIYPVRLSGNGPSIFRREGVYVILGGRGGIGQELALYLGRNYNAKIALIGRKQVLDAKEQESLKMIEKAGGKVKYIAADGGNEVQMREAINNIEAEYGRINGVIHSAIVLNDKQIRNMEEDELRKVLWPKVDGSIGLYKAVQGKAIDFMLYLSSVQSFTGMAGQSNYSAACTFKDSYCRYVGSKEAWKARVINWGYWGSVGVVASKEYQKRMSRYGIYSIEVDEAMACIERVLGNPVEQVIVFKGSEDTLAMLGVRKGKELVVQDSKADWVETDFVEPGLPDSRVRTDMNSVLPEKAPNALKTDNSITEYKRSLNSTDSEANVRSYIESVIIESFINTLGLSEDQIDTSKSFRDFGIDSITGVNAITTINEKLEIGLKTIALFDYSTISDLTDYIYNEYKEQIHFNIPNNSDEEDYLKSILSDLEEGSRSVEDVNELLRRLL
ncbi:MAG TPA: SDR family NAD(P)-dependent oxidoreductase, partial [Ruminiclostridium sp.]|nr:SDR family NAD(P)-dependent oxidoreductase [Ruminiclostridium sp.]